ncbi:MAG: hypothetical protein P4M05_33455 [Bradyrhizobium sp.]|nr:hypothetical protein [Bradyrhizobium sp.]
MSDEDASAGATLLLTINQSGLIFAHSMHVGTFNVHPPGNDDDKAPRAAAAVGYFAAELARIVAQEVMILSRVIPSFINTSLGRDPISDDWNAFRPPQPSLYPTAAEFRDLLPEDGTLLVEYYDSLNGIRDILDAWTGRESVADVNAWNVLMQTLQKSLQLGLSAVERFCPDRQFSSTSPAGGTLADNIKRVDASVKNALKAHLARHGVS